MSDRKKVIIVGSGAGGAAAALELADVYDVTILEAGKEFHPFSASIDTWASLRKTGLFLDERMIRLLLPNMQVRKSESMIMVNGIGVGGTTPLATGNAVRSDQALKELGIDLDEQFDKLYETLPITRDHQQYWNPAARELFRIFEEMGLDPQATPKFLKKSRCANCGHCAIGCPAYSLADWSPLAGSAAAPAITEPAPPSTEPAPASAEPAPANAEPAPAGAESSPA